MAGKLQCRVRGSLERVHQLYGEEGQVGKSGNLTHNLRLEVGRSLWIRGNTTLQKRASLEGAEQWAKLCSLLFQLLGCWRESYFDGFAVFIFLHLHHFQHQNLTFWRVILTHPLSPFFPGILLSLLVVSSCLLKRGPVIISLWGCFFIWVNQFSKWPGKRQVFVKWISILFFLHEMTTYTSKISTYTPFFPRTHHVHTVHKKQLN